MTNVTSSTVDHNSCLDCGSISESVMENVMGVLAKDDRTYSDPVAAFQNAGMPGTISTTSRLVMGPNGDILSISSGPNDDDKNNNNKNKSFPSYAEEDIFYGLEDDAEGRPGSPPPPPPPKRWWNLSKSVPAQTGEQRSAFSFASDRGYQVEVDAEKADLKSLASKTTVRRAGGSPQRAGGSPQRAGGKDLSVSFGSSRTVRSPDTVIQHSMIVEDDGDSIDVTTTKDAKPSCWARLGDEKVCGITYRLLLLLVLIAILSCLVFFLILRVTLGDGSTSSSESQASNGPTAAPIVINGPPVVDDDDTFGQGVDTPTSEGGNNVTGGSQGSPSPQWFPCNDEGVTSEDGIILLANQVMEAGQFRCSPSQEYMVGLSPLASDGAVARSFGGQVAPGEFVIQSVNESQTVVWSAGVTGGARVTMEESGNLVIEDEAGEVLWSSGTTVLADDTAFRGVVLSLSDEGTISVQQEKLADSTSKVYYWIEGNPAGSYTSDRPTSNNLEFPIRGTFYFSNYDNETSWTLSGESVPQHQPTLGWYTSSDPDVVRSHVDAMTYGKINLGINSWSGPNTSMERTRMTMLLEETSHQNSALQWTVLDERERLIDLSIDEIRSDLDYLKKWYAWRQAYAHIDGRPVIFVNNDNDEGCGVSDRWMEAAGGDWFVLLRIFEGFDSCEVQPDSWFNQFVNNGVDELEGVYHNLSPGKWKAGDTQPELAREDEQGWCENVQQMDASGADWQLVITFNEGRMGTSIESSEEWESESGYGWYLDCLHNNGEIE